MLACNGTDQKKKENAGVTIAVDHAPVERLSDNEVKAAAPDATMRTEQGYALPRHTGEHAQSPIDIITRSAAGVRRPDHRYSKNGRQ